MKDADKRDLARMVKWCIGMGMSKTRTVERLKGLGWKKRTIGVYYKTFSEAPIS